MSSKINSSFLYSKWEGKAVSRREKWENLWENWIFSPIESRGGRKKQQSEAVINCVFLHITIGSEWIFYCFDIILEEYFIVSRASWEFLSKYCALQKKCWKQNGLISFSFCFGSFHLALRLLENNRSLQVAPINYDKNAFNATFANIILC